MRKLTGLALLGAALWTTQAPAQNNRTDATKPDQPSKITQTGKKAGEIVTQPARDVGVEKAEIPPVLEQASDDPYSLSGLKTCKQLAAAVSALNEALGPDYAAGAEAKKENRAGKLAEAGGKTIVNSILPFRGLVREISGAAPAQRRLEAAVTAGYARRGFLRGVHQTRKCKTQL
jgi:hypothetical protein